MDKVGYNICRTQADLYKIAAENGYDMEDFSFKFLSSSFCEQFYDAPYSRYQYAPAQDTWDDLDILKDTKKYDGRYFDKTIAGWIGYFYRYLSVDTSIKSSDICKSLTFKDMVDIYPAYHVMDENLAIEKAVEAFGLGS